MICNSPKKCLVLYDWPDGVELNKLFLALFEFAGRTNLDIPICSVGLPGAKRARKMKVRDLLARIESGEVIESIELYLGEKRPGRDLTSDADAYLVISADNDKDCLIVLPLETTADSEWEGLIERLAQLGSLTYGGCFTWRRRSSPGFYAVGIIHSVPGPDGLAHPMITSPEEARRVHEENTWYYERLSYVDIPARMRHRLGYFRDVYEKNILSAAHVEMRVNDRTLGDIIRTTPGWGTLRELEHGNWLWSVDEAALEWIRQKFEQWKLLIRCLE